MIGVTTSVVLTGGIVAASNLIDSKPMTPRLWIGWGVYAVSMAAFAEANNDIAAKFAGIVLATTIGLHLVKVSKGLGFA